MLTRSSPECQKLHWDAGHRAECKKARRKAKEKAKKKAAKKQKEMEEDME